MKSLFGKILFLVFIIIFFVSPSGSYAADYVDITETQEVKVLKIIDGASMVVELTGSREMAMIQLIGIATGESETALSFLNSELMGKTVIVTPDPSLMSSGGRKSLVYLFFNNELFNKKMLVQGHAKVNTTHSGAAYYNTLTDEATRSELERIGVWGENYSGVKDFIFNNGRVNINTASVEQLQTLLDGVDIYLAERIVNYRRLSPFRTVGEIKFVLGFTKELYDKNHNRMVVSTNVTDASKTELETLTGFSSNEIDLILDYRENNRIAETTDLLSYILSIGIFDSNKQFMDTRNISAVNFADPNVIVNINTAELSQLLNTGLEFVPARLLIDMREAMINTNPIIYGGTTEPYKRNYTLKTLGELSYFPGIEFTQEQINSFADNFRLRTDINTAGVAELLSLNPAGAVSINITALMENRTYRELADIKTYIDTDVFGSLQKHMYMDNEEVTARININTANKEQMIAAGFSEDQAVKLVYLHKMMKSVYDIPFNLEALDLNTALYTNVNKALYNELISLNEGMTPTIAMQIIAYRDNQPIGSYEELRQIFVGCNAGHVFENLKGYMVLR